MITIWGRANSVNVQKVLWCCDELVLPYERIDAGLQFGRNNEPDYLAMNPTGKIPTLVDDDFVLWESNSILRYLVLQYGESSLLYPAEAETARQHRPLAGLDARPRCNPLSVRCSGRSCARRPNERDHDKLADRFQRGQRAVAHAGHASARAIFP